MYALALVWSNVAVHPIFMSSLKLKQCAIKSYESSIIRIVFTCNKELKWEIFEGWKEGRLTRKQRLSFYVFGKLQIRKSTSFLTENSYFEFPLSYLEYMVMKLKWFFFLLSIFESFQSYRAFYFSHSMLLPLYDCPFSEGNEILKTERKLCHCRKIVSLHFPFVCLCTSVYSSFSGTPSPFLLFFSAILHGFSPQGETWGKWPDADAASVHSFTGK